MEAKLIKRPNGIRWDLYLKKDINMLNTIASSEDGAVNKLSLKNCEAIANAYDLDELAKKYAEEENDCYVNDYNGFKQGFQKALEILGDKKFSELDLYRAFTTNSAGNEDTIRDRFYNVLLPSIQQTEWQVEIVTTTRMENGKSGLDVPVEKPKLDPDGCLILKRI